MIREFKYDTRKSHEILTASIMFSILYMMKESQHGREKGVQRPQEFEKESARTTKLIKWSYPHWTNVQCAMDHIPH
ncbi:hypothetical protein XENOCAPTIV_019613 [Xenoophorus captivus]|uniref:Uncharacterized protein n=1 Tax=Xenoophorus captivus TaxID=1517983 RepID=A0ABV0QVZ7_9TELE